MTLATSVTIPVMTFGKTLPRCGGCLVKSGPVAGRPYPVGGFWLETFPPLFPPLSISTIPLCLLFTLSLTSHYKPLSNIDDWKNITSLTTIPKKHKRSKRLRLWLKFKISLFYYLVYFYYHLWNFFIFYIIYKIYCIILINFYLYL